MTTGKHIGVVIRKRILKTGKRSKRKIGFKNPVIYIDKLDFP